jgi:CheY-like chemotaxis protein
LDTEESKKVVIICPNCKRKLKMHCAKHSLKTPVFKCPACCKVFVPKKSIVLPTGKIIKGKILVAHSDTAFVDEITSCLEKNGYQTVTSSNGIAAIITAVKESPSLVVIEGNLPKINGFEVYRRVRTRTEVKEAKFVFVASTHEKIDGESTCLRNAHPSIEDNQIPEILLKIDNIFKK